MVKCPQCLQNVPELVTVNAEMIAQLAEQKILLTSNQICRECLLSLKKKTLNSGGVLLAEEKAKEERKNKLWNARISLVKQANTFMEKRLYSEAAVTYEKYIKLLEVVFNAQPGQLSPSVLKDSAKTAELTIIAGVYWDLVRIYDTSDIYLDRQKNAAHQLAKFVTLTPIYSDIMKKAEIFQKSARHPEMIGVFFSSANEKRPRCFIATAAFKDPNAIEVQHLRRWRDTRLKASFWGRKFVYLYYRISPPIACYLDKHESLKPFVRAVLRTLIKRVT